ncbi:FAD/NAD(P)-binding domain-containing protein [Macrolepiota fuliginosa MF-IS2]|uniref:FAD/NAD(P)-binding domain-containing protein n=1 Tax=Macrolepiota fuliginosa MF-IS2 TaxID=1400762 RepID=A0A9P5XQV9_9AGAR|nr:FAD/NAD(P)-binding domain-containing protein [Macrolepiota fuliginosa MF-IS2]
MDNKNNRQNIVIAGLGSAGARLAHLLLTELDEAEYNIVIVSPRPFYILYPATARLVVSDIDNLQEHVFIPVDKILKGKGTFIQAKVAQIEEARGRDGGEVVLDNGERMPYRVLVLATGASWEHPLSFPNSPQDVLEYLTKSREAFEKAKSILLIGAGAVGVEIAGEIKDIWPKKKVTIVHGGSLPFSAAYPDRFRRAAESSLRARDVELVLGDYVDEMPSPGDSEVRTRGGRALKSDLVLSTRGQRFNTDFIAASLGEDVVSKQGLVKIQPTFQVVNRKDIFAIGDIIDWNEQKQLAKANKHADLAAKNICGYLAGTPLRAYKGEPEMIVVTNGRNGGVGYLGILWGIVLGGWFARMVKSRKLLLDQLPGMVGV